MDSFRAVELIAWLQELMAEKPSFMQLSEKLTIELARQLKSSVFFTTDTDSVSLCDAGWSGFVSSRDGAIVASASLKEPISELPAHARSIASPLSLVQLTGRHRFGEALFVPIYSAGELVAWCVCPGDKVPPSRLHDANWRVALNAMGDAIRVVSKNPVARASSRDVALLEHGQRFAGFGIWERELASDKTWWSDYLYHLLGYGPDVRPSLDALITRVVEEDRALFLRPFSSNETERTFECRVASSEGEERVFACLEWIEAEEDGKPARVRGMIRDLSEVKQAAERQRMLEVKLRQALKMESLGVLAGGVAHDFNNILMGIVGFAELALSSVAPQTNTHQHINAVLKNARRASARCEQLLSFAGRRGTETQRLDISRVVRETGRLLSVVVRDGVFLRDRLVDGLPSAIADSTQIREVTLNLLTNAADAIHDDFGTITMRSGERHVDVSDLPHASRRLEPGRYVYFQIEDDGCGIPESIRDKIFDPFFTTKLDGHGLGLATTIGIVHNHGGAVVIDSVVGQGTSITILLPCQPSREYMKSAPYMLMAEAALTRPGGKILFADDEPMIRTLAKTFIGQEGYEVVLVENGLEVIEALENAADTFDAVVIDMIMPKLDGVDTLTIIRERWQTLPVIVSSGYSRKLSEKMLVEKGVHAFLQKPYEPSRLLEILEEICAPPAPTSE